MSLMAHALWQTPGINWIFPFLLGPCRATPLHTLLHLWTSLCGEVFFTPQIPTPCGQTDS